MGVEFTDTYNLIYIEHYNIYNVYVFKHFIMYACVLGGSVGLVCVWRSEDTF